MFLSTLLALISLALVGSLLVFCLNKDRCEEFGSEDLTVNFLKIAPIRGQRKVKGPIRVLY